MGCCRWSVWPCAKRSTLCNVTFRYSENRDVAAPSDQACTASPQSGRNSLGIDSFSNESKSRCRGAVGPSLHGESAKRTQSSGYTSFLQCIKITMSWRRRTKLARRVRKADAIVWGYTVSAMHQNHDVVAPSDQACTASPQSGRNRLGIHRFSNAPKSRCRGAVGPSLHGESAKRTQSSGDTPFQQCTKITMSWRRRTKLARRVRKADAIVWGYTVSAMHQNHDVVAPSDQACTASPRSGRNRLGIHRFSNAPKSRCRGAVGPSLHGESAKRTQSSGDTPFQQCTKITMSWRRRTKLARRVRKADAIVWGYTVSAMHQNHDVVAPSDQACTASPRSGRNRLGIHRFSKCIKSRCRGAVGPSLHGESAKRTQSSGDTPFQQCIKITMSRRRRTKLARRVRKADAIVWGYTVSAMHQNHDVVAPSDQACTASPQSGRNRLGIHRFSNAPKSRCRGAV